jgi:hypothetical protein
MEQAAEKFVKDFFQCDGFKNLEESENQVTHFLPAPPNTQMLLRQFHDDPDIYVLSFDLPYEGIAPEVVWEFNFSPWRYVSSSPPIIRASSIFGLGLRQKTRQ